MLTEAGNSSSGGRDRLVNVILRAATSADSGAIAGLVTELGYPVEPEQMEKRLLQLLARPEYTTLVVEISGEVVGMVGAYLAYALEFDGTYARLTGLIVDARWRGRGLGKLLMRGIETSSRERGATVLTLTSGRHRSEAHGFYKAIGYDETGIRFVKRL